MFKPTISQSDKLQTHMYKIGVKHNVLSSLHCSISEYDPL